MKPHANVFHLDLRRERLYMMLHAGSGALICYGAPLTIRINIGGNYIER